MRIVRVLVTGFVVGLLVVLVAPPRHSEDQSLDRPLAPGSPAALIAEHDCWTGDAPADMQGVIPGHAVVTWPGDEAPTYGGRRAVSAALEHLFGERRTPGLVVHAFCR